MKKQLLALCLPLAMAFTPFSANAAMILGFDAGVYVWSPEATGTAGAVNAAGLDGDNNVSYFAFEHPVPFVPNVKLQVADMAVGTGANLVDLSHIDQIIYHEILDNFVSADVGLAARAIDGSYDGATIDETVYMVYASAEVEIPVTGLSVGMEVIKDFGLDKNGIYDVKIRARYEIMGGLGVEVGQRTVTMDLKERAPTTQDLEFDGTYFALTYTF